jgi:hypothetical protein
MEDGGEGEGLLGEADGGVGVGPTALDTVG